MKHGIPHFGRAAGRTGLTAIWEPVSLHGSDNAALRSLAWLQPLSCHRSRVAPENQPQQTWRAEMPAADAEPVMDGSATFAPPASPSQQRPGDRAVSVLWSFGKCLGALLPVYLAGYYGFSITLVLFGLIIFMGWKHSRLDKTMRLKSAMYLLENERAFTTESVFRAKRDLPPWVSTHDLQLVLLWRNCRCEAVLSAAASHQQTCVRVWQRGQ